MGQIQGNEQIVTNGLVLSLDAADRNSYPGSGASWFDMSGNGRTSTLNNGPAFNSSNGGSIVFDPNQNLHYGSFASTTVGSFNNATFSYGAWFYHDGNTQFGIILGKRSPSPFNQYSMGIGDNAQFASSGTKLIAFALSDSADGQQFNYSYQLPSAGWYHGMVVINNNVQNMYANGVSVASSTATFAGKTFNITNKPFYIAAQNNNFDQVGSLFRGRVASVFLYNRALTAAEVLQNYNAEKSRFGL
jgi:hypothetical protein